MSENQSLPVRTPLVGLSMDQGVDLTMGRQITLTWDNPATGHKEEISNIPLRMLKTFSRKIRDIFNSLPNGKGSANANHTHTVSLGSLPLEHEAISFLINQMHQACTAPELKNLNPPSGLYRRIRCLAAAIALDVHPTVHQWRTLIFRISGDHVFTLEEVAAVWECLREEDRLVKHVLHSVAFHVRKDSLPEKDAFEAYFGRHGELRERFDAVLAEQEAKSDARKAAYQAVYEVRKAKDRKKEGRAAEK